MRAVLTVDFFFSEIVELDLIASFKKIDATFTIISNSDECSTLLCTFTSESYKRLHLQNKHQSTNLQDFKLPTSSLPKLGQPIHVFHSNRDNLRQISFLLQYRVIWVCKLFEQEGIMHNDHAIFPSFLAPTYPSHRIQRETLSFHFHQIPGNNNNHE